MAAVWVLIHVSLSLSFSLSIFLPLSLSLSLAVCVNVFRWGQAASRANSPLKPSWFPGFQNEASLRTNHLSLVSRALSLFHTRTHLSISLHLSLSLALLSLSLALSLSLLSLSLLPLSRSLFLTHRPSDAGQDLSTNQSMCWQIQRRFAVLESSSSLSISLSHTDTLI